MAATTHAITPARAKVHYDKTSYEDRLSGFTRGFLHRLAVEAHLHVLNVTSTSRTAVEQADAMYDKIAKGEIDSYKAPGQAVQEVGFRGIRSKADRNVVIHSMLAEIDKVGFFNVSQHAGVYGLNVIDISYRRMKSAERSSFTATVKRYLGMPVFKFGHPGGAKPGSRYEFRDYGCFHLAILQPDEADILTRTA